MLGDGWLDEEVRYRNNKAIKPTEIHLFINTNAHTRRKEA